MHLKPIDYLMGIAVPLTWGMGFVFAKAAMAHFPPIFLMALRFAITAAVLIWFVPIPRPQLKAICAITLVSATIQYSLTFNGLKGLDASIAILVIQLEVPFLVLLGAFFLNETVGVQKWAGIALAFVGVALIAGTPHLDGAWWSLFLVLSGALAWAVGQAMVRRLGDVDGLTLIAWVAVFAAPQLLITSLLFEDGHIETVTTASWRIWALVFYLGLVMTAFGYTLWYTLLRRHPISSVGSFLLLLPVFSVVGAVVVLGERPTAETFLGGLIILVGLAVIMTERRGPPHKSKAPQTRQ